MCVRYRICDCLTPIRYGGRKKKPCRGFGLDDTENLSGDKEFQNGGERLEEKEELPKEGGALMEKLELLVERAEVRKTV